MNGDRISRAAGFVLTALLLATGGSALAQAAGTTPAQAPAAAAPAAAAPAAAAVQSVPVVMVVDFDNVLGASAVAKTIQSQIEAQRANFQKELSARENELRNEEQELQKQQSALSADAFNEKRQAFGQKVNTFQNDVQIKRRQLDAGLGQALDKARAALVEVVRDLAVERKANLVMYRAQLILFDQSYDASDEALKRLNAKLSSVTVTIPKASEVTAPPAGAQNAPAQQPAAAPAQAAKKK